MEEREDLFFKNVTVQAVEEYLLALRINTYSMTQRPGLEIKTEVTAHMLCLCYKPSSLPCLQEFQQHKARHRKRRYEERSKPSEEQACPHLLLWPLLLCRNILSLLWFRLGQNKKEGKPQCHNFINYSSCK